jgi:hypothetical protein
MVSYIYVIEDLKYHEGRDWVSLTDLTQPHSCTCPKPRPGFPMPYVLGFFLFNGLRRGLLKVSFHNHKNEHFAK